MTQSLIDTTQQPEEPPQQTPDEDVQGTEPEPLFIIYLEGHAYHESLQRLVAWVHFLLIPVYGRELSSSVPWCPQWWKHSEAVAQLHGLSLAWQDLTGPTANLLGPATWHRDFLGPVMSALRDPAGPFAGCKPGVHRDKQSLPVASFTVQ